MTYRVQTPYGIPIHCDTPADALQLAKEIAETATESVKLVRQELTCERCGTSNDVIIWPIRDDVGTQRPHSICRHCLMKPEPHTHTEDCVELACGKVQSE